MNQTRFRNSGSWYKHFGGNNPAQKKARVFDKKYVISYTCPVVS